MPNGTTARRPSPCETPFPEELDVRLRDDLLNETQVSTLNEAQKKIRA